MKGHGARGCCCCCFRRLLQELWNSFRLNMAAFMPKLKSLSLIARADPTAVGRTFSTQVAIPCRSTQCFQNRVGVDEGGNIYCRCPSSRGCQENLLGHDDRLLVYCECGANFDTTWFLVGSSGCRLRLTVVLEIQKFF